MNKTINRLLLITGIFTVAFGICAWLVRDTKGNTNYYHGDNTVKLCEYIEVQMLKTNTEVIPYDGDRIRIQYQSLMPISTWLGDNRLIISESDEFKLSFMTGDPQQFVLRLYLPQEIYKSISLTSASGNVTVGRVDSYDISVITKSGDITATDTRSLVSLNSGAGDIRLDFEAAIGGSSISTARGNAEITFPEGSSVALSYGTDTGKFRSNLLSGSVEGSYMYSFGGGYNLITAEVLSGTLTVNEVTEEEK